MSESRKNGRNRLRHLQEITEARGEEMDEQRPRFDRLRDDAAKTRAVSSFNLFQTPPELAARLASMFTTYGRTLEPSAGLGRLYSAVRAVSRCEIVLVENAPQCAAELYRMTEGDDAAKLIQDDFLTCDAERLGLFGSVIMNPPFKNGRDILHVRHALKFLRPGGRLVSVVADGPRQRAKLQPIATEWHTLAPGSFKSEGTNVGAALFVYDKEN